MGFFSANCEGCGHPLLSIHATHRVNQWMTQGVAITPCSRVLQGRYDGYGRLGAYEDAVGDENTVWHNACWRVAGSPLDYRGRSAAAEDQGWFFEPWAHALAEPKE